MLGVRDRGASDASRPSAFKRLQIMLRIIRVLDGPKQIEALEEQFAQIQRQYEASFLPMQMRETLTLVSKLKEDILAHWDITLVNDLYAFVYWTPEEMRRGGAVQAEIAGIEQIESMRPVFGSAGFNSSAESRRKCRD